MRNLWPGATTTVTNAPQHTRAVFDVRQLRRTVEVVSALLLQLHRRDPFYAIAGCGNSGTPVVGALSVELGIPIITVRKPGEVTRAAGETVTGAIDCGRYVIIEDLVSSGKTINWMMDKIFERSGEQSVPVGIVTYRTYYDSDEDWRSQKQKVKTYGVGTDALRYIDGKAPYRWQSEGPADYEYEGLGKNVDLARGRLEP